MSATLEQPITPDAHVIARNMVRSKGSSSSSTPAEADFARAMTNIQLVESIKQVNTVTVSLDDPGWSFLDSGFFDADANGFLDPIDLNYPEGSRYWWRMTQVNPSGAGHSLDLGFMVRDAVLLMHELGPAKANRAKMTRAQFLKMLARKVPDVEFYSRELDVKEPIAAPLGTVGLRRGGRLGLLPTSGTGGGTGSPTAPNLGSGGKPSGKATKLGGIGANTTGLTVKGAPMSDIQKHFANVILAVAEKLQAPDVAMVAMIYAAIWESSLGADTAWNSQGYGGVLDGHDSEFATYGSPDSDAVSIQEATSFMKGGRGFGSGGAINLSRIDGDPVSIATRVEGGGSYSVESGYPGDAAAIAEAQKIVTAGGGAGNAALAATGSHQVVTVESYFYEIMPKESYWKGMLRLASEVNWDLFWDGHRLYYDSEQALIKQRVAAEIERGGPAVTDWNYEWDTRQISTQMSLTLIDEVFGFHAGEVFQMRRFGTASTGSSASPKKLPGRWLIQDRTRNVGDITTQYTLIQPDLPKLEPAPQINTRSSSGIPSTQKGLGSTGSGTVRQKIVAAALKAIQRQAATGAYNYDQERPFPLDLFGPAPVNIDCSAFCILCYKAGGGPDPSGNGFNGQGWTGDMEPNGAAINLSEAQPADLVFYPGHVALYLGNNQIANMGSQGEPVQESVDAPLGGIITSVRRYLGTLTSGGLGFTG